jgi:hypothetical protein
MPAEEAMFGHELSNLQITVRSSRSKRPFVGIIFLTISCIYLDVLDSLPAIATCHTADGVFC